MSFILIVGFFTGCGAGIGTIWDAPAQGALIGLVVGVLIYSLKRGWVPGFEGISDWDFGGGDSHHHHCDDSSDSSCDD